MLFVAPEPRYVFGPDGPRWVPSREMEPPAVVENPNASAHRQILRNRKADQEAVEELKEGSPRD